MPAAEVTLRWEIDGEAVPGPSEAEAFVNATPERRAGILQRIVAHVKTVISPRATAKFQDAEEAVMMKISAAGMGARALDDALEGLGTLEFDLDGHSVKVTFEDITAGGRRRKTTKKSRRKSRKVTRRRRL